jgi:hypothetical protein
VKGVDHLIDIAAGADSSRQSAILVGWHGLERRLAADLNTVVNFLCLVVVC